MDTQDIRKERLIGYLKGLRAKIIAAFESLEPTTRFVRTPWEYAKGTGGGEISLLRGDVFEKAAVNWSGIWGPSFPMQDGSGPFFATGISLITHMQNPFAPTLHFNLRYIETENRWWLGGGYDLTPMGFPFEEDTRHFHNVTKNALDPFGKEIYLQFSKQAQEYFYLPHRKKERGVGGIFFDHYNTGDEEKDLLLWQTIGDHLLQAIMPIYQKRTSTFFTDLDKELQLKLRAHYVEFNLLYDRGTKFGFLSGGNPDAILCSMPPLAKW